MPCRNDKMPVGLSAKPGSRSTTRQPERDRTGMAPNTSAAAHHRGGPRPGAHDLRAPSTMDLGEIKLPAGQCRRSSSATASTWSTSRRCVSVTTWITLKGFDDTVVVFRVAGTFRIGTRTHVLLENIKPENILWQVSGAGRFVRIGSQPGSRARCSPPSARRYRSACSRPSRAPSSASASAWAARPTRDAPPVHRAPAGRHHRDAEPGGPPAQPRERTSIRSNGSMAHPRHRRRQHGA